MKKQIASFFLDAKLNQKIRMVYIGVIIGYLVLFLVFGVFFYYREIRIYALENDKKLTQSAVRVMISESKNVNNMTKAISSDAYVKQYLTAGEQDLEEKRRIALGNMYQYVYLLDYVSSIYVVRLDTDYINVETNRTTVNTERIRDHSWGKELEKMEGGAIYRKNGNGAFTRYSGDNTISYMRAVYDFNNLELIGYLSVNMNMSFFENACQDLLEEGNAGIAIRDDTENLAVFGQKMILPKTEKKGEWVQRIFLQNGVNYSLHCSEIGDWDLYFLLEKRIVFSDQQKLLLFVLLGATFLFSVLAWSVMHRIIVSRITAPIAKLVASMEKVKGGQLHRVSVKTGHDEIGMLKDSYNMMLVEMNNLITELVEKEKKQQKLELDILQEQIKPHFLYNILYRIESMAMENQDMEVMESLQTLGDFYRKFLSKGEKSICLIEEMDIVRDYLKLQCLRYADEFTYQIEMDKDIEKCLVPKLILQPLVENSIYHGVRLKGEDGSISVKARKCGDRVRIHIYDNGVGMSPDAVAEIMERGGGKSFGLKATIERIQYYCGVQDVYEIYSEEGEYMEVVLKLPCREEEKGHERD